MKTFSKITLLAGVSVIMLSACTERQLDRLSAVGEPPPLQKVEDPSTPTLMRPVNYSDNITSDLATNSLWQPGSKTFFRDQRARNVGDILKIKVKIADKAAFDNKSNSKRDSSEKLGTPKLFGYESLYKKFVPGPGVPDASNLLDITGNNDHSGEGKIDRKETIETEVAATVTQVLPNGNFVIKGSQEIRVNFEVRELTVEGIIRPEDIDSKNTIESNKIAEARISYGGRGIITEVQQPRLGHQVVDILSPF